MSLVVIVPGFGGVHLFTTDDAQLKHHQDFASNQALLTALRLLDPKPSVVLCAGPIEPEPYDAILDFGDVFIIPELWLHPLPKHAIQSRARLAVRLFDTHRAQPIQHLFGRACPETMPF